MKNIKHILESLCSYHHQSCLGCSVLLHFILICGAEKWKWHRPRPEWPKAYNIMDYDHSHYIHNVYAWKQIG